LPDLSPLPLKKINLSFNQFAGIPDTIFKLRPLQALLLRGNEISVLNPKDFSRLEHLEELDLDENPLDGSVLSSVLSQLSLPFPHRRF